MKGPPIDFAGDDAAVLPMTGGSIDGIFLF